jgi:hypothetical protein
MKKIKRALAVSLGLCTLFSNSVYAAPLGKVVEYRQKNQIGQIAEELQVSEKEIENLGTNLNHALQKTPELEAGEKVKINVSENLYLEIESYEEDDSVINNHRQNNVAKATKKTYHTTCGSIGRVKNLLGKTVVTLKAYGVFERNGKISKPIDAYGTYTATVWNVTSKKATKGKAAYNAYVKNTFTGKLNVGTNKVNMTLESFKYVCTTYCNAKGKTSSKWRT